MRPAATPGPKATTEAIASSPAAIPVSAGGGHAGQDQQGDALYLAEGEDPCLAREFADGRAGIG